MPNGLLDFVSDEQSQQDMIANILNLLRAASNTTASTVSGPVDAIASGLGKAGLDIPMPIGGSQWMQNAGLLSPVVQGPSQIAGEALGLLAVPGVGVKYGRGLK